MADLPTTIRSLRQAIGDRDIAGVRRAIALGADVKALYPDGYSPLCFVDDPDILQVLLDAGADPNLALEGEAPDVLYYAAFGRRPQIVRLLLDHGASVAAELRDYTNTVAAPSDRTSSVHAAVENQDIEILAMLLHADGQSVLNSFDYISRTPLMIAANFGDARMVQLLIDAGSNVNARDEVGLGDPAIRKAVKGGNIEVVRILLDAGADIHQIGWMHNTAYSDAESLEYPNGAEILALFKSRFKDRDQT